MADTRPHHLASRSPTQHGARRGSDGGPGGHQGAGGERPRPATQVYETGASTDHRAGDNTFGKSA